MSTARIYSKGQVTIPRSVREAAGLEIGDRVVVEARGDEVVVRRPQGVLEFKPPAGTGSLPWPQARDAARDERVRRNEIRPR